MVSCPKCNVTVGELDTHSGVTNVVCPTCKFAYRLFLGKLVGRNSRQVTVRRQTTKQSGIYKREYELRLDLQSGERKVFQFSVPGREDWILVRRSDLVCLIYMLNRTGQLEEILSIVDITAGSNYAISKPGAKARSTAGAIAVFAFIGCTYFFWSPVNFEFIPSVLISALIALVGYLGLAWGLAPRMKIAPTEHAALTARNKTLAQKDSIEDLRDKVAQDLKAKESTLGQLRGLHTKMRSVGAELYQSRLDKLAAAISAIELQTLIDYQLIRGYERLVTMIDIELESNATAGSLPDSVSQDLSTKLAELRLVQERHHELELQLSANEEVEHFLKVQPG